MNLPANFDDIIGAALEPITTTARVVAAEMVARGQHGERSIIVDGSHYAPSWRAIGELETLYQSDEDGDISEAIGYALDDMERDAALPAGAFLSWDDGCLFVELPDDDDGDDAPAAPYAPMTPALRVAPGSVVERFAPTGVYVRTSAGRSVYVDGATPTGALDVHAAILSTLQTCENRTEPSGQWSPHDLALTTGFALEDVRAALDMLAQYRHVHARYVGGVSKYLYDISDDAPKCAGIYPLSLRELESLPTLGEAQTDSRKVDAGDVRVWLARTGVEDGEPWPDRVTVEQRTPRGSWADATLTHYQAR